MPERIKMPRKKFEIIFECQSCEKDISLKEQKDVLALYFAHEFDEYYCPKCANDRHEFLLSRLL